MELETRGSPGVGVIQCLQQTQTSRGQILNLGGLRGLKTNTSLLLLRFNSGRSRAVPRSPPSPGPAAVAGVASARLPLTLDCPVGNRGKGGVYCIIGVELLSVRTGIPEGVRSPGGGRGGGRGGGCWSQGIKKVLSPPLLPFGLGGKESRPSSGRNEHLLAPAPPEQISLQKPRSPATQCAPAGLPPGPLALPPPTELLPQHRDGRLPSTGIRDFRGVLASARSKPKHGLLLLTRGGILESLAPGQFPTQRWDDTPPVPGGGGASRGGARSRPAHRPRTNRGPLWVLGPFCSLLLLLLPAISTFGMAGPGDLGDTSLNGRPRDTPKSSGGSPVSRMLGEGGRDGGPRWGVVSWAEAGEELREGEKRIIIVKKAGASIS